MRENAGRKNTVRKLRVKNPETVLHRKISTPEWEVAGIK